MFRSYRLLSAAALVSSQGTECKLSIYDNYVAQIVFDRPEKRNALGRQLLKELQESLKMCNANPQVRAVVLSSNVDKVFCAGADLKERKTMTPLEARDFVNSLRTTFCELEDLSVPVIAVVEGAALGGGLEIALACDIRISGANAKLGVPETALAIIPGAGGTQRLTKIVGLAKAKELTYTAKPVTSEGAAKIGLVNHAVESGKALETALEMAKTIGSNGPIAVVAAKTAISQGFGLDRSKGMMIEQLCYDKVLASKDRLEGLQAFAEKRKPSYKGE